MVRHLLLGLISLFVAASPALAESAEPTTDAILILDGSGSMWARMDGEPRIVVAKKVISNLLDELPDSTRLGLMAYGHNRKGDCGDIEMLVDVGGKRSAIKKAVDGVSPKGKTPMTDAVIQAAEKLKYTENAATIILVSDGEETCNVDPCEAAERLNELGVSLKVHTVGFALEEGSEGLNQLQCMAENTGGQFFATQNAQELASALTTITEEQPEQKPVTPASFTVALSATSGQDGPVIEDDLVWTIQAEGDDQPVYTSEPGGSTSAELEPGTYHTSVLRISDEAGAEAAFDITDADTRVVLALEAEHAVSITAPDSAVHGSDIEISWTDATDPLDLIVIVPADTKEGEYKGGNQAFRVRDKTSNTLRAPDTTGLYEIRYLLDQGKKTLARQPIEVTDADVSIKAPEYATRGSNVEVSWSDSINPMDLIVIVPADTKEGEYKGGNQAFRVRSKSSNTLRAPDATGLYEIRYLLDQGKKTLASQPIEVTDTEVTLTLSDSIIRAGDTLDVSWSEAVNNMDLIVIVPMGTAENKYSGGSQSFRVRNKTSNSLKTPEQTGLYEVRYLLDQGKVMMASETVEVVDADAPLDDGAGLKAPEQASPGETINVSWTRNAEGDERIALAEAEQPDFSWISADKVEDGQSLELTLPDEAATYEIRYLDISNREVLGRTIIKVE